jgi:FkbM family methyltransferase
VQPWIAGTRLWARRGETGITGNLYAGLHEFEDMAFALHVLRPDSLFVDVGANAGSYSVLAAGVAGSRVLALEPVPGTFARLVANLELNGLTERVRALNVAAGSAEGALAFTSGSDVTNHALHPSEADSGSIVVPVSRIDDVLAGEVPELVKVDVEGYEYAVIDGGPFCFSSAGANSVLVELNGSGERYGWRDAQVAELLFAAGYSTYAYEPFTRRLQSRGRELRNAGNTLFIRDVQRAQALVGQAPRFKVKGVTL